MTIGTLPTPIELCELMDTINVINSVSISYGGLAILLITITGHQQIRI